MSTKSDFWLFIDKLEKTGSFTKEKIEKLFNAELRLQSNDQFFSRYLLKKIAKNGFPGSISGIDLRINEADPGDSGFLIIDLSQCDITRDDILQRFPKANVEPPAPGPPPQGFAPDAEIHYWVQKQWGQLSFGFLLEKPAELASIVLDTKEKK